jgi:hypothetical protein
LITLSAVVISPRFLPAGLRCLADYEDFIITVRFSRSTYNSGLSMYRGVVVSRLDYLGIRLFDRSGVQEPLGFLNLLLDLAVILIRGIEVDVDRGLGWRDKALDQESQHG